MPTVISKPYKVKFSHAGKNRTIAYQYEKSARTIATYMADQYGVQVELFMHTPNGLVRLDTFHPVQG